jgi:uncharacterized oligopeptide transporter (OPT) family protein
MDKPTNADRIYEPEAGEAQLSFRAVLTGCILGAVVAAMNISLGLKIGWSLGGSLIAAILGYTFWMPFKRLSVLETNIAQTAGSACGSMASTAGLLSAIPALAMLGTELSWGQLVLWGTAVGFLGVFYAVPLRNQMVVLEKLRFPTGTATANTIQSMHADGAEAVRQAKVLLKFGVASGLFALGAYFIPQMESPPLKFGVLGLLATWTFKLYLSPVFFGVGGLVGMRVGASMLVGAVVAWGLVGPWAKSSGLAAGEVMSYADGPRGWLLWPGVALMVMDAFGNLALSWKSILRTFTGGSSANEVSDMEDPKDQIPTLWWMGGLLAGAALAAFVSKSVFDIPVWMTLVAVAMSWILAMIAVRSTGETDINPIGGMGKVTQLTFGALAPGSTTTNLMAAGITSAGASQAGDMMHDLKTGRMLGAAPRKQFIAQCLGIISGIPIATGVYTLYSNVYDIGFDEVNAPAPAAHAWKAMSELLAKGFEALPQGAGVAVAIAGIVGLLLPVVKKILPEAQRGLVPSGLAMGIAFIVPAYYSVAIFLGCVVFGIWKRRSPEQHAGLAFAVASGVVAGDALMNIPKAVLSYLNVSTLTG